MPRRRAARATGVAIAAGVSLLWACGEPTAPRFPVEIDLADPWVEVAPVDVAIDAGLLERAASRAAQVPRFRSLLVARRGRLAFERYFGGADASSLHDVRSVTKSIVSILVGIALVEGSLPDLDVSIGGYLDSYALDDADREVSVRHLVTMTSGYQWSESGGPDYNGWILSADDHVQYLLDRPRVATPGTRWNYNSAAVHTLGVVLEQATGMSLVDYAREHLFAPAGITSARWEVLEPGRVNGGSGIDLRARDLLRLGQLVLQEGRSGGRQVVPAEWIRGSTTTRSIVRTRIGPLSDVNYGHLWWTADGGSPRGVFAWGFGGQFVYVVPDRDLVVVATTEWRDVSVDGGPRALEAAAMSVIVDVLAAAG